MPYNTTEINLITPYMSNTTNVTLNPPIYSGRYATLIIQGNQASNATNSTGATVAEWAIIAETGSVQVSMEKEKRDSRGLKLGRLLRDW